MTKNKKIIFKPSLIHSQELVDYPTPAYNHIPFWYKDQKLFSNGESDFFKANQKSEFHTTYKACTPLVDTLTSGYMITSSADIIVSTNKNDTEYSPYIDWHVSWSVVDLQPQKALGNYPIPNGYNRTFFRWNTDWSIKTPDGYSLWITHPSHRYDLPFLTINGFVDTDVHPNRLFLPFFIKEGFQGIIPAGTPIAQAIPVKRDNWSTGIDKFDVMDSEIAKDRFRVNFLRGYKHKYWIKKRYE